jgi:tryptophan 7-halogenase
MTKPIKKVVIVGGGTAGWMSAALLKKVLGHCVEIELVESEEIGRIGVGEATIPPIRHVNEVLGIDEADFIRATKATIKLGIQFERWGTGSDAYFHTFGTQGKSMAFCSFHHFWTRANQQGMASSLWDYDLNYWCIKANKFAPITTTDPLLEMRYAYHFDAALYAAYLRKYSEGLGVKRTESVVTSINLHCDTGDIESLNLQSGVTISGDLFLDCSGLRALLIQQKLKTGFEDWSHWLPCNKAVAVPSERLEKTLTYTRAIAHPTGWQWRIPLQHRNGNGLVYSSEHCSDDEAAHILLGNLHSSALGEPSFVSFNTGRCRQQWNRNVIAVGLSGGFLEPLESTSIHLIQSAIVRLIKCFPHAGIAESSRAEYNRQSKVEYEQVRDFIILHYHTNGREDHPFWINLRNMNVPESLTQKIDVFRAVGAIHRDAEDLFHEPSWLQVLIGQGVIPQDYHPLANSISDVQLKEMLENIKKIKQRPIDKIPTHDEFLRQVCAR